MGECAGACGVVINGSRSRLPPTCPALLGVQGCCNEARRGFSGCNKPCSDLKHTQTLRNHHRMGQRSSDTVRDTAIDYSMRRVDLTHARAYTSIVEPDLEPSGSQPWQSRADQVICRSGWIPRTIKVALMETRSGDPDRTSDQIRSRSPDE